MNVTDERFEKLLKLTARMYDVYRRSKMSGQSAFTRYCQEQPQAFVDVINEDRDFFRPDDFDDEDFGEMIKHLREDEEAAVSKMERLFNCYRETVEDNV